jgi:hypothetical protein
MNTTTTTTPAAKKTANQFGWHRNPNPGAANGPCEVCGCAGKVRAKHRALKADELGEYGKGAAYAKMESRCFGNDWEVVGIDWNGNKV